MRTFPVSNVPVRTACEPYTDFVHLYLDPFGTHHSKMLILFRHDDTAQVIIHTANMIDRDWSNMTQAVWASPPLPLLHQPPSSRLESEAHPIGSGRRFKIDLLRYLSAYEKRLKPLTTQLKDYDFSRIRAAFIGSAPSRQKPAAASAKITSFGWLGLQEILSRVPISESKSTSGPHIITQISSIATLGPNPTWLSHFQSVLARYATTKAAISDTPPVSFTKASTFFAKCDSSVAQKKSPKYSVVFPTPEEIRTSLDGYSSGHSIHWKLQSAQQQKQLEYMHPLLCHWRQPSSSSSSNRRGAHRGLAAPHIKTYIRISNEDHKTIDWAMVTSANLSKQAWGDVVNKKDEIWIQSWETGVVVWPALFAEPTQTGDDVVMVPVFGKNMPGSDALATNTAGIEESGEKSEKEMSKTVVCFRMPYDLPLVPYTADERPWCATMQYSEPDRNGHVWGGYGL
jgi:tyrosyl-DNA phosphodiesterase-1